MATVLLVLNLVTTFVLALFVTGHLPAYFREKGKNLATKEDIEAITRTVEAVRAEYASDLQERSLEGQRQRDRASRMHEMRLADIARRLEAHQQAYTLWRRLLSSMHSGTLLSVVVECQSWWETHCLYLDEEAREAFLAAYHAAAGHKQLLEGTDRSAENVRNIRENMERVSGAGEVIVRGAALPSLAEREHEQVPAPKSNEDW